MKLNNDKFARIVMILSILISIPLGNYLSISKQTKAVMQEFIVGEDGSGMSAFQDVSDRYNDAINLRSLARRYEVDATSLSNTALDLFKVLDTTPLSIQECATLNNALTIQFDETYRELKDAIASSSANSKVIDLREATGLYDDFHSSANILSRSHYNTIASEYNQMLQSFPNHTLSFINQAKPMPIFGE